MTQPATSKLSIPPLPVSPPPLIMAECGADTTAQVAEPLAGTFSFDLFTPDWCAMLWHELHHYKDVATKRPGLGLPLRIRHDGCVGELQSCGFAPALKAIERVFQPLVARHMPAKARCEVYHAFFTSNFVGRDEQFKTHCDKSELTLNICLHASEDLQGSGVGFYRQSPAGDLKEEVPREPQDRVYTHDSATSTASERSRRDA